MRGRPGCRRTGDTWMRGARITGQQCRFRNAWAILGGGHRWSGPHARSPRDGDHAAHTRSACRDGSARTRRRDQRVVGSGLCAEPGQRQLLRNQGVDQQLHARAGSGTAPSSLAGKGPGALPGIHRNGVSPDAGDRCEGDPGFSLHEGGLCRGGIVGGIRPRKGDRGPELEIQNRRCDDEAPAPRAYTGAEAAREPAALIVESVPNFSEGRDPLIVASIARAVSAAPGVTLLDTTSDQDHNRSVLTFAGAPRAVADAAFLGVREAVAKIDLSRHAGVHPRLGAADVIPLVPVEGTTIEHCATLARALGERIWKELGVPVYLYEAAALRPECKRLENVRKLAPAGLAPDFGTGRHPTAGASVVGARKFLIAWNINLRTTDLAAAREIARSIRESSGGLPALKSIGLPLESRGQVQVSINLVDFERTPLYEVFDAVKSKCDKRGVEIAGSELIGMLPAAALRSSEGHDLQWQNLRAELVLENRLLSPL